MKNNTLLLAAFFAAVIVTGLEARGTKKVKLPEVDTTPHTTETKTVTESGVLVQNVETNTRTTENKVIPIKPVVTQSTSSTDELPAPTGSLVGDLIDGAKDITTQGKEKVKGIFSRVWALFSNTKETGFYDKTKNYCIVKHPYIATAAVTTLVVGALTVFVIKKSKTVREALGLYNAEEVQEDVVLDQDDFIVHYPSTQVVATTNPVVVTTTNPTSTIAIR